MQAPISNNKISATTLVCVKILSSTFTTCLHNMYVRHVYVSVRHPTVLFAMMVANLKNFY